MMVYLPFKPFSKTSPSDKDTTEIVRPTQLDPYDH